MGPGQVNFLQPGENIVTVDPKHPVSGFAAFCEAVCTQMGAALEIPSEWLFVKDITPILSRYRTIFLAEMEDRGYDSSKFLA